MPARYYSLAVVDTANAQNISQLPVVCSVVLSTRIDIARMLESNISPRHKRLQRKVCSINVQQVGTTCAAEYRGPDFLGHFCSQCGQALHPLVVGLRCSCQAGSYYAQLPVALLQALPQPVIVELTELGYGLSKHG